jgi:two-component system chemotaxis response regulator CheY
MKILQFEPEEMLRNMYEAKLKNSGFEFVGLENPLAQGDPITLVLQEKPDLIITDLHMPNMDGFSLIKLLKNDSKTKGVPIIVLTNYSEKEHIDQCFSLGADDYFIKAGNTPSELTQRIKDYLDNPKKYKSTLIEQAYKLPLFFKFEGQIFKAEENKDKSVSAFIFDESLNDWRSISFGNFIEASNWGKKIENPKLPKKI